MKRGEVYYVNLNPTEGSEINKIRPAIIVSNNEINQFSSVILIVPCTTYKSGRKLYRSQVLIKSPEGGLTNDSVALSEQMRSISKTRVQEKLGQVSDKVLTKLDQALAITLNLSQFSLN